MVTHYITNFTDSKIRRLLDICKRESITQKTLWKGTVFVGKEPIYIECNYAWLADKIEDFFYRVERNIKYDNSKSLYILDLPTCNLITEPEPFTVYVCFSDNNINKKPDVIVHNDCCLLNNGDITYLTLNVEKQLETNNFHLGENHILMRVINYLLDNKCDTNVLHCAAVEHNGRGILISGLSGYGKSTLAAYCAKIGMGFVGDDRTAVCLQNGKLLANPVYKTLSLAESVNWLKVKRFVKNRDGQKDVLILEDKLATNVDICAIIEPCRRRELIKHPVLKRLTDIRQILAHICTDYSKLGMLTRSTTPLEDYAHIYNLLKNIPCFKLTLGQNIDENAKEIYNLIKEMR